LVFRYNAESMKKSQRFSELQLWDKYYSLNIYYHAELEKLATRLIPPDSSVLEFGCKAGELLGGLPNINRVGIDDDEDIVKTARKRYPTVKFFEKRKFRKSSGYKKYDYILLSDYLAKTRDVQIFIRQLKRSTHDSTRIIVTHFNFLWKPFIDLAERVGLKLPQKYEPNWLSGADIENFFQLESYEKIKSSSVFLFPIKIPIIAPFINRYIAAFPLINRLCMTSYEIYRPAQGKKSYSVSVIIPTRNEEGNIRGIAKKIPNLGTKTELIFVEGHSQDDTLGAVKREVAEYKGSMKLSWYKQKGKGKGDAVRLGFSKAKNELLMILDADLTVAPRELKKFYEAASIGRGDLIMGSRLVYPMEDQAMRTLNYFGNKIFSIAFSYLLDQRIKDTLCGTKVILKENYKKIETNRKLFGDFDPFGDYDLIFGAAKLNLKIIEIPVRYKERTYGTTNISRFVHVWLLLAMVWFAIRKLKFN